MRHFDVDLDKSYDPGLVRRALFSVCYFFKSRVFFGAFWKTRYGKKKERDKEKREKERHKERKLVKVVFIYKTN